jgi:ABC-type antimicrobial peptide transport system permease subunit
VSILWLILRQGLGTAAAGIAVGLGIAAATSRVIGGVLVGVTPHDVLTFVAVPTILLTVSTIACLLPASRAIRVDLVEVLRTD